MISAEISISMMLLIFRVLFNIGSRFCSDFSVTTGSNLFHFFVLRGKPISIWAVLKTVLTFQVQALLIAVQRLGRVTCTLHHVPLFL